MITQMGNFYVDQSKSFEKNMFLFLKFNLNDFESNKDVNII